MDDVMVLDLVLDWSEVVTPEPSRRSLCMAAALSMMCKMFINNRKSLNLQSL